MGGELIGVKDWLGETSIERNRQGKPIWIKDYTGKCLQYEWGGYGEKRRLTYPNGKVLNYVYDDRLFLKELIKEEPGQEQVHIRYQYDSCGRLIKKTFPRGLSSSYFSYDNRGNLTAEKEGNVLKHAYCYNAMNRLSAAINSEGEEVTYRYNGLGQRVGRNEENYLLDLTADYNNLLTVYTGEECQDFFADNGVLFMEEGKERKFFLLDELGSPLRVLYGSGKGEVYGYDEFGQSLEGNGYAGQGERQPFGYTGYLYDSAANTYFAQAREYQPERGRFVNRDKGQFMTVGDTISANLYIYCKNNPLIYTDGLGNEAIIVTGGIEDDKAFRYPFVETALKKVYDSIDAGVPKEDITWMVIQAGYDAEEMEAFQTTAENIGIKMVAIETKDEFVTYINEKDGGMSRAEDRITEMTFFGHGQSTKYGIDRPEENQLSFAYHTTVVADKDINFKQSDIALLESEAFDHTNTIFYTCNAGTKDANGKSFAQEWSNKTGGVSYGIQNGRTDYSMINMAGKWGLHSHGWTFFPGEIYHKLFNTQLWQEKQARRTSRSTNGYSELGSLNYPWMTSIAGDPDTILDGGVFTRGWKKFYPECQVTD